MAHLSERTGKRGTTYRAEIELKGVTRSKSFRTKAERKAWVMQEESAILSGFRGEVPNKTFGDLLDRYETEVSAEKKGYRWESIRIATFKKDRIAKISLRELSKAHISDWLSRRRKEVSSASCRREMNIISHVCGMAANQWGWLNHNPCSKLTRPKPGEPRTRILMEGEWQKLLDAAKTDAQKKVIVCAEWALETGMRAGEICNLSRQNVDTERRVATIVDAIGAAKSGSRQVPLSARAVEIVLECGDSEPLFGINKAVLDTLWRKLTKDAEIDNLHFHDLRATAITRLSKVLGILPLMRMIGHKDTKMLAVYYRETAEDVAKLLSTSVPKPRLALVSNSTG